MNIKLLLINFGKLLVCAGAFALGMLLGGMLATGLKLPQPVMPAGLDASSAGLAMILESPLWALVLILLARHLAGNYPARALMLAALAWVSNSLNNQIEAAFFGNMGSGFWFSNVTFLVPSLLVAAAVAWLFPPVVTGQTFSSVAPTFFARYSTLGWVWRLALGVVLFMPIYYFFGLLVVPFTIEYYRQGLYGLQIPPLNLLLAILSIRSLLFFLACLPILLAWQGSRERLVLYLGLALFYFVGFQALLIANWMPWSLRLPHLIEILADEFVYAGGLALLFGVGKQKLPGGAPSL